MQGALATGEECRHRGCCGDRYRILTRARYQSSISHERRMGRFSLTRRPTNVRNFYVIRKWKGKVIGSTVIAQLYATYAGMNLCASQLALGMGGGGIFCVH